MGNVWFYVYRTFHIPLNILSYIRYRYSLMKNINNINKLHHLQTYIIFNISIAFGRNRRLTTKCTITFMFLFTEFCCNICIWQDAWCWKKSGILRGRQEQLSCLLYWYLWCRAGHNTVTLFNKCTDYFVRINFEGIEQMIA